MHYGWRDHRPANHDIEVLFYFHYLHYIESMNYSLLSSRKCLRLDGDDIILFLQGLISNNAAHLEDGRMLYATLLTPQGKFLHDFFLFSYEGDIILDCDAAAADALKKRLMLYKLRSKISIEPAEDMAVIVGWQQSDTDITSDSLLQFTDPRHPALGIRIYGKERAMPDASYNEQDYHAWRIRHGVPDGSLDLIAEKSFLLEWGIDQLHGVDYEKGCYVGQEVTARTHYRGNVKKAPYMITGEGEQLPEAGTEITCGDIQVGEMRSSVGGNGIGLLRIAGVQKAKASGQPICAGDIKVEVKLPDWFVLEATTS